MEDTTKILIVAVAIMLLVAAVSIVGIVGMRQAENTAQTQLSQFQKDMLGLQRTIETERTANQTAQNTIKELKNNVTVLTTQNSQLRRTVVQPQPVRLSVIEEALRDYRLLNLYNCNEAINLAQRYERDVRDQIESLNDQIDNWAAKRQERLNDLRSAVARDDARDIVTQTKRVEYAQDKLEDLEEQKELLEETSYDSARRTRIQVEAQCRRIERVL